MIYYSFWLYFVELQFELFCRFERYHSEDQRSDNNDTIQKKRSNHSEYPISYNLKMTWWAVNVGILRKRIGRITKATRIYIFQSILWCNIWERDRFYSNTHCTAPFQLRQFNSPYHSGSKTNQWSFSPSINNKVPMIGNVNEQPLYYESIDPINHKRIFSTLTHRCIAILIRAVIVNREKNDPEKICRYVSSIKRVLLVHHAKIIL